MENKMPLELGDEDLDVVSGGANVMGAGTRSVKLNDSCKHFVCASCDGGRKFSWSKT